MSEINLIIGGVLVFYLYNKYASGEGGFVYQPENTYNSDQTIPIVTADDVTNILSNNGITML